MSNLVVDKKSLATIGIAIDNAYSPWVIRTLIKTSFPTLNSIEQVIVAFQTAKMYDLDPRMWEMYAWVDKKDKMINIASASGFMKIARREKWFVKIEAHAVYEGEDFSLDTGTGEVSHKVNLKIRASGKDPVWAYAKLEMIGKNPQVKFVNFWNYYINQKSFFWPWEKQKDAMIEKCAVTVLCRQAFWLSWLYGKEEMDSTISATSNITNDVNNDDVDDIIKQREKEILGENELTEEEKKQIEIDEATEEVTYSE